MARKPSDKPWLHSKSGFWCATVNGKREYLDRDYRLACRKLKELRNQAKREVAGGKPATYASARYRLLRALRVLGTTVRVGEVRKSHLARIERALNSDYSPTTVRDTLAIVSGVFSWALKQDYLEVNPLVGYEKPAARRRNRIRSTRGIPSAAEGSRP